MKPNSLAVRFLLQIIPPMAAGIAFTIPFFFEDEEDRMAREAWDAIEEREEYEAPANPRTLKSGQKVEVAGGEESARSPHMAVDTSISRKMPRAEAGNSPYTAKGASSYCVSRRAMTVSGSSSHPAAAAHTLTRPAVATVPSAQRQQAVVSTPTPTPAPSIMAPTGFSWGGSAFYMGDMAGVAVTASGISPVALPDSPLDEVDDALEDSGKPSKHIPTLAVADSQTDSVQTASSQKNAGQAGPASLGTVRNTPLPGEVLVTSAKYPFTQINPVVPGAGGYRLAAGVDLLDPAHSDRFYDSNKGARSWVFLQQQPYKEAVKLYYETGSYDFLGSWAKYVVNPDQSPDQWTTFTGLLNDSNTCWYQACSNQLSYWESFYGVFCKDSRPLPYGTAYGKEITERLGGTQSNEITRVFYDNWDDVGGMQEAGYKWYLLGFSLLKPTPTDGGKNVGFFKEYFDVKNPHAASVGKDMGLFESDDQDMRPAMKQWMDETLSVPGQLCGLDIYYDSGAGHGVTCYGYTLDADGNLESLLIADSDDYNYGFRQYFMDSKGLKLYQDQAHTIPMKAGIIRVQRIATPAILQRMLAEYNVADMVWNGAKSEWGTTETPYTVEVLPTAATGWDAYAVDDYYHTYFDATRLGITFNDHASVDGSAPVAVTVTGIHNITRLTLGNKDVAYTFTGADGAAVRAEQLIVDNSGHSLFENVDLSATLSANIGKGTLAIGEDATFTAPTVSVTSRGGFELAGGEASVANMMVDATGNFISTAPSSFTGNVTMKDGSFMHFTLGDANLTSALLSWNGSLTLEGLVNFRFSGDLTDAASYKLISFTGGSGLSMDAISHAKLSTGTLSYQDNVLSLNYKAPATFEWDVTGTHGWSSTVWEGNAGTPDNANLIFTGTGGTVNVSGDVTPISMSVNSGEYTWKNGASANIDKDSHLTLSGTSSLTLDGLALKGNDVELKDSSTLTVDADGVVLGSLKMQSGTNVSVADGRVLELRDLGTLDGTITTRGTGEIRFKSEADITIGGKLSSAMTTGKARFLNGSEDKDITYNGGAAVANFAGRIYVGSTEDAHGTTLRMESPNASYFDIAAGSTLELTGSGKKNLSQTFTGSGTLRIAQGAQYVLDPLESGLLNMPTDMVLDIRGGLQVGTHDFWNTYYPRTKYTQYLTDAVRVSGSLTVYTSLLRIDTRLHFQNLTLDGGTYCERDVLFYLYSRANMTTTIQNLTVTEKGGSIYATLNDSPDTDGSSVGQYATQRIVNLSGSGDLVFSTDTQTHTQAIEIVNADAYTGNITVRNDNGGFKLGESHRSLLVLELGDTNLAGTVKLGLTGDANYAMAALGINGDATVGGLEADTHVVNSMSKVVIYSGRHTGAKASENVDFKVEEDFTVGEHTLTIQAGEDHDFTGTLFGEGLSLIKTGSGTQKFSGRVSTIGGSITVDAGALDFGTSSLADVQDLRFSDRGTLAATDVTVHGAFSTYDSTNYLDETPTEQVFSAINANLDLTNATSINLGTTVNMTGHALSLASGTDLLGYSQMTREEDGYAYCDLFTNISGLTVDGTALTAGAYNDLFGSLQLANDQQVWFSGNSLSIRTELEFMTLPYGQLGTREKEIYTAESTGVLTVPVDETVVDLSGHPTIALGAAADTTSRVTSITLADGSDYRFGGPGTLQVDMALTGARNVEVDSQGFTGGRIELLQKPTLTGDVVVQGGKNGGEITLAVTVANGLQSANSVTVYDGGILEIAGNQASNVTLDGGTLSMQDGAHMDNVTLRRNSTINVISGSASLGSGASDASAKANRGISDSVVVTKTGAGELELASKYATGSYNVQQGSLNLSHFNYDNIKSINVANGAKLRLTNQWTSLGPAVGTATDVAITLDNNATMEMHNGGNNARVNADITLNANGGGAVLQGGDNGNDLVVAGTISGAGELRVRNVNTGNTWALNSTISNGAGGKVSMNITGANVTIGGTAANTYTGDTVISGSTVTVKKDGAFGAGYVNISNSTRLILDTDLTIGALGGYSNCTVQGNGHTLTFIGVEGQTSYTSYSGNLTDISLDKISGTANQIFQSVESLHNISVASGNFNLYGVSGGMTIDGQVSVTGMGGLQLSGVMTIANTIQVADNGILAFANTTGTKINITKASFTDGVYVIAQTTGSGLVTGLSMNRFQFSGGVGSGDVTYAVENGQYLLRLNNYVPPVVDPDPEPEGPLTWDGTNTTGGNTWGDRNWEAGNNVTTSFTTDSDVYFTGTAQNKDVQVVSAVSAGAMSVSAAGYTFSGQAITTTGLTLENGASATFNNALTVTGNVSLAADSNLKLTHDATLNIVNTSTGTLEVGAEANVTAVTGANDIQFHLAGEGGVTITGANKNFATTNNAFAGTLTINLNNHIYIGPTSGTGQTFTAVNGKYANIVLAGGNKDKGFVLRECYDGETNAMNIGSLAGGDQTVIRGDAGGKDGEGNLRYIALHQDDTTTFAGIFRGGNNKRNPGLIMNGLGTIKLTGTSASTANLIANSGTIELSGNGYWAGDVIIRDGGQLDLKKADAMDASKTLTITGMGVKNDEGTVVREGALKLANGLTLAHAVTTAGNVGASVMTDRNETATISGTITGTGITKVGAGTLSLTGGATVDTLGVGAGTLNLSNTVTVANSGSVSGTLNVTGGTTTVNNLTVNAGGSTHVNNGGTLSVNGGTLKGVTAVDAGGTLKLDGTVSGTAEVQVKGNLNVLGGTTTVDSLLGLWGGTHTIAGTVNAKQMVMVDKNGGNASLTIKDGGKLNITGDSLDSLVIAGWANAARTGALTVETGGSLTAEEAVMRVSYWNGPTGTVNISGGSVEVKGISFVQSTGAGRRGNLSLSDGGELTVGSEGIKGVAQSGSQKANVTLGDGTVHASADWTMGGYAAGDTLVDVTLNGTGTGTNIDTNGHNVAIDNNLTGSGKLVKSGTGDLTLKGANTNTGAISVQGGSLKLAEDAAIAHSNVTVASTGEGAEWKGVTLDGATLAASAAGVKGEIAGTLMELKAGTSLTVRDVVIADDTAFTVAQVTATSEPGPVYATALEPSESVHLVGAELKLGSGNTATVGMLTGTKIYAVNCTSFTNLALDGTLTVDIEALYQEALKNSATHLALHFVDAVPVSGSENPLSVSSTDGLVAEVTTVAAYGQDWTVNGITYGTAGDIVVYWNIPEPATAALSVLALAALAARRRRRK